VSKKIKICKKYLVIISVDFNVTDQLLITLSALIHLAQMFQKFLKFAGNIQEFF